MPVYNENKIIVSKLQNLLELDYPPENMNIIIADACSTDGTPDAVKQFILEHPSQNISLLSSLQRGRSHQINIALQEAPKPDLWVLTDADAFMEKETLRCIVAEFQKDEKIGVVGAYVEPQQSLPLEHKYWQYQNILRWLESNIHSASIVVGPCYAFKPFIITAIPEDCASDDIYVSLAANAKGYKVKYIFEAKAYETRTPTTILEYINHKFRKGNAYIIEILRFLYLLPTYCFKWKLVYITKFMQILIMPFVTVFFALVSINISFIAKDYFYAVLAVWGFLFVNVLITSRLIKYYYKRICRKAVVGGMIESFVYNNFILLCAVLSYLIYYQDSKPEKIDEMHEKEKK